MIHLANNASPLCADKGLGKACPRRGCCPAPAMAGGSDGISVGGLGLHMRGLLVNADILAQEGIHLVVVEGF